VNSSPGYGLATVTFGDLVVETTMRRPLFLPTARQTNWLLIVGFLALGEALYLRYMALENNTVALACQGGDVDTWLCATFRLTIVLFNHRVFGIVALVAALLNLLRPSIVLVAFALAASAFGIVLHNADLSGLAAGVLILSLARLAPASE
jgi:hypothetical protein